MKKRVLIVHREVLVRGGAIAVCAWAIEALRDDYEVSLATLEGVDCAALNRHYGTSLREDDFHLLVAPPRYQRLRRWMPTKGALLDVYLIMRWAQTLDRRNHYDILLSTQNEMDFGRRGITYIHHPAFPQTEGEKHWFHRIPGVLRGYQAFCEWLGRFTNEGLRRNLALANSNFIRGVIRQVHGIDARVLHPPVPGGFVDVPWSERRRGFVAVGRISPEKRWERAVEILDEVRRRGFDVTLTLIGHAEASDYRERLRALAAVRPWFRLAEGLTRQELVAEVPRHRYGIHTMVGEHFGIGPAEIQRAACVLFAQNSGGPIEIVDDPDRLFDTVGEAADKIERMLNHSEVEEEFRQRVAAQRERFSEAAFCQSLCEIVSQFR
jgi:glycosyltransferase involved in cell wall biosynthesis